MSIGILPLYPLLQGEHLSRQEIALVKLLLLYMFILSFFYAGIIIEQEGGNPIHSPKRG